MPRSWISQLIQIRSIGASDTSRQDISCDPRKLGVARPDHLSSAVPIGPIEIIRLFRSRQARQITSPMEAEILHAQSSSARSSWLSAANAGRRFHYGWMVAAVTFATLFIVGLIRGTSGIMVLPFEAEFHWSRATISAAVGTNMLVYGLMAPFAGGLLEMLSLRHVVLAALTSVAAGLLFAPFMHHSWQLILLWGGLVGTATGFTANVLAAVVATRWFAAKRGLVTGVLTAAAGAGQFLFLPAIAELTTTYGWCRTSESFATAALLLVPVVARFMRDRPEDIGLHRYGEWSEDVQSGARPAAHNPLRYAFEVLADALRWREFWLICASLFISGVSTSGLTGTHLILASADHGSCLSVVCGWKVSPSSGG
jgi:sugar phosphate permease